MSRHDNAPHTNLLYRDGNYKQVPRLENYDRPTDEQPINRPTDGHEGLPGSAPASAPRRSNFERVNYGRTAKVIFRGCFASQD